MTAELTKIEQVNTVKQSGTLFTHLHHRDASRHKLDTGFTLDTNHAP